MFETGKASRIGMPALMIFKTTIERQRDLASMTSRVRLAVRTAAAILNAPPSFKPLEDMRGDSINPLITRALCSPDRDATAQFHPIRKAKHSSGSSQMKEPEGRVDQNFHCPIWSATKDCRF